MRCDVMWCDVWLFHTHSIFLYSLLNMAVNRWLLALWNTRIVCYLLCLWINHCYRKSEKNSNDTVEKQEWIYVFFYLFFTSRSNHSDALIYFHRHTQVHQSSMVSFVSARLLVSMKCIKKKKEKKERIKIIIIINFCHCVFY